MPLGGSAILEVEPAAPADTRQSRDERSVQSLPTVPVSEPLVMVSEGARLENAYYEALDNRDSSDYC